MGLHQIMIKLFCAVLLIFKLPFICHGLATKMDHNAQSGTQWNASYGNMHQYMASLYMCKAL